jgi:adenylate kinase
MKATILLGAPGAGKGTIAEMLVESTDYRHVSTGDMLREAVKEETSIGRKARSYMEAGELVPDDVILGIVRERLQREGTGAQILFDGFPRTLDQARLLDDVLADLEGELIRVFLLDVPRDVLVDRLSGRRICRQCGAVYHVRNIPPKQAGVCDKCGGELYQRPDDTEETVRNRLDVFKRQTESLIGYYEQQGTLQRVAADRGKEETEETIRRALRGADE